MLTKQFEMPDEIMALPSVELLLSGCDTVTCLFSLMLAQVPIAWRPRQL